MDSWRVRLRRRVPALSWRDRRIRELLDRSRSLRDDVAGLRAELARARAHQNTLSTKLGAVTAKAARAEARLRGPSFNRELLALRNKAGEARRRDPEGWLPISHVPFKLRNYQLAASHGISVPEIYAVWPQFEEINLNNLPNSFVLKSDHGSAGRGVIPLRRVAPGHFELADGTSTPITSFEITRRFQKYIAEQRIGGPFFAEELLTQAGSTSLPVDIKVYAAYGDTLQVLLRQVDEYFVTASAMSRYVDASGTDLGNITESRKIDPTIEIPDNLLDLVDAARHLSRAIGRPFCRVDLYNTTKGIVLGEITAGPGGPQLYRRDHDETMGRQWLAGDLRLQHDIIHGRPIGPIHGEHRADNHYPPQHPSKKSDAGPWTTSVVPCDRWCTDESL